MLNEQNKYSIFSLHFSFLMTQVLAIILNKWLKSEYFYTHVAYEALHEDLNVLPVRDVQKLSLNVCA